MSNPLIRARQLIVSDLVVAQSQVTGLAASLAASIPESQVTGLVTDLAAKAPVSTAVTLTGPQALTNKTLTSPHLTGPVVDSGGLTVTSGNVGVGGAPIPNVGLYLPAAYTIHSAPGAASGGYIGPTLIADASSHALYGLQLVPSFNANSQTNVYAYGLNIPTFSAPGAQNAYGIYVGAPSGASGENLGIKNLGNTELSGSIKLLSIPTFGAGDKYLVLNGATGEIHLSTIGPAS